MHSKPAATTMQSAILSASTKGAFRVTLAGSLATIAPAAAAAMPATATTASSAKPKPAAKSKGKAVATATPTSPIAAAAAAATTSTSGTTANGRRTHLRNPRYNLPATAAKDPSLNVAAVGEPVCEIMINGYVKQQVLFFSQFAQRTIQHLGMPLQGPITVSPHVRRWTVLTSPFKYKKFQETFERKTFKRRLTIYASSTDAVDKCLHYLSVMMPAGLGLRVVRYEREEPGVAERMKKAADDILAKGGNVGLPQYVYLPKRDMYEVLAENIKLNMGAEGKQAKAVVVEEEPASGKGEESAAKPESAKA
ncbi:hypothetical protein BCR44DRAFT_35482 [Catenaria anguillulae PL171]|uniref:Small ribosomal subunit protein uS10 domain-containing protein n=1 Tax=Catenaria anguillulae PL171 TaxID=765915 RepID=A0A1Y2HMN6_9FUNG|nr:hypothetical protein BCR44DRAFT_35482 [Catenaria anguillulae PL171]